ncbi:MaoC family dehydratase N-terminal domain-containing protein [Chloroflexota bacterium]
MDKFIEEREISSFTFPVERGKIREFAAAIYDDNPIYWNEEYANGNLGGIIAPPTFVESARFYTGEAYKTQPEEIVAGRVDGGREFEYMEPIFAGDVLTGNRKIIDVYDKAGSNGGNMRFHVLETVFTNQKGHKVLVMRETIIELNNPANR